MKQSRQAVASGYRPQWALVAAILASSMSFIDSTVVNVALPAIQRSLNASAAGMQWVVEAYTLALSALILAGGSAGDLYGRRLIFASGTALFAAASVWCGLAPNISQLILARGAQGIGGAMLVPSSLALISAAYPESERGKAIGTWSAYSAVTTAIGPVLGGWMVTHLSWRSVFWLNIPFAVTVLVIAGTKVAESRDPGRCGGRLDWLGAFLASAGLGGIVYGLLEHVPIAGIVGALLLAAFVALEMRISAPMMPPALFRSPVFTGANLLTLVLYGALGGMLFFLPLTLMQAHGYAPAEAGASVLPMIVLIFVLSRWIGALTERVGMRLPLAAGCAIASLGFAILGMLVSSGGEYWTHVFPPVVLLGLAMSLCVTPLTTGVMQAAPSGEAGVASGVNNAVSRVAGLLAIAVFGVAMGLVFNRVLDGRGVHLAAEERAKLGGAQTANDRERDAVKTASLAGFAVLGWTSAALAAAGTAVAAATMGAKRPAA